MDSGDIAVWVLGPKAVTAVLARSKSLSPAELVRATTIARPDKRQEFIAGRCALRWLLAGYLEVESSRIEFDRVAGPLQVCGQQYSGIACSISHRHGRIAIAISTSDPIGIDLEQMLPPGILSLSSEILHGTPANLSTIKPAQALAAWCELEALTKLRRMNLFEVIPEWRQICNVIGFPSISPVERNYAGLRFSHWEPFSVWRLVLASNNLAVVNIRISV